MPDRKHLAILLAYIQQVGGKAAAARLLGCTPQFIGQVSLSKRPVPDAMLVKIAKFNERTRETV